MTDGTKLPCRRELKQSIMGILIYVTIFLALILGFEIYPAFIENHLVLTIIVFSIVIIFAGPLVASYLMCIVRYNRQYDQKPWDKKPWSDS
jgi:NhaP-type Na+/H+ and K+/H+ antiporter